MVKQCAWCGKEFVPRHGNQKHCSDECRKKANSNKVKEFHKKHRDEWNAYSRKYRKNVKKRRICSEKNGNCFECPYEDCIYE